MHGDLNERPHNDDFDHIAFLLGGQGRGLAEREGRTLSELFGEAFREYQAAAVDKLWKELDEDPTRNPHGYTEDDIPRLIKEVRAEMAAEEAALMTAKVS